MAKYEVRREPWDADAVRALRSALGDSQQEFADRLGTRQQTVSEWERGSSKPARMAQRLLTLVAEQAASYRTARDQRSAGPPSRIGGERD